MVSLAELKKNSNKVLENLKENLKKEEQPTVTKYVDERYWQPTVDEAGNGKAIIRFLPAKAGEDSPWKSFIEYSFKGPSGKWYFERSPKSIDKKLPDPAAEYKNKIWNSNQELARNIKRKQWYISNIYVVSDPGNPENNGKVFLYQYGKKIFDKIQAVMFPDEEFGEESNDPTNFWTGQNFHMIIKMIGQGDLRFRNYDDSKFAKPTQLFDKDERIEEIWNQQYSLDAETSADKIKSYDDLKKRFDMVMTEGFEDFDPTAPKTSQSSSLKEEHLIDESVKKVAEKKQVKKVETKIDDDDLDFDIDELLK